jgi:hypothetical protein
MRHNFPPENNDNSRYCDEEGEPVEQASRSSFVAVGLVAAIAILLIGCSGTGNDESASVIGTWVNASYDANSDIPGKIVVHPDYSCDVYDASTDPAPGDTGTYAIVDQTGGTFWR